MRGRCLSLMVALEDGSAGLEGTKIIEIADEIEMFVKRYVSFRAQG
jgi:son of sevenless-like protein